MDHENIFVFNIRDNNFQIFEDFIREIVILSIEVTKDENKDI